MLSYCLTEFIIEEVNSTPDVSEIVDHLEDLVPCNYETLFNFTDYDQDTKLPIVMSCLIRASVHSGDEFPLSRDTIKLRLATEASHHVNDFDSENICSAQELEEITFKQFEKRFSPHMDCVIQQILKDLTDPEYADNFEFSIEELDGDYSKE